MECMDNVEKIRFVLIRWEHSHAPVHLEWLETLEKNVMISTSVPFYLVQTENVDFLQFVLTLLEVLPVGVPLAVMVMPSLGVFPRSFAQTTRIAKEIPFANRENVAAHHHFLVTTANVIYLFAF